MVMNVWFFIDVSEIVGVLPVNKLFSEELGGFSVGKSVGLEV